MATDRVSGGRRLVTLVTGRLAGLVLLARERLAGGGRALPPVTNPAPPALRRLLHEQGRRIACDLGDPRLGEMFERQMLDTWETTLRPLGSGRTFVITGDIPAMWLRDSSAQLRPFLLLLDRSDAVRTAVVEVIAQQWDLIATDPYANAFNRTASGLTWHVFDLPAHPRVWERKYEIDSLAFPVQLAWQYWRATGSVEHLTPEVRRGFRTVVGLWRREQHHAERSTYRFLRPGSHDSLPDAGRGAPVGDCGLTWSAFRPSDDRCELGYNIPGQLFAAHACTLVAELSEAAWHDDVLAGDARALGAELTAAVQRHGITAEGFLAYEVDGLGGQLIADDANMPSLLSLPLCSAMAATDPLYLATRRAVLSDRNPFWFRGRAASGVGSPHTPGRRVWPIALAVQALTSTDREEQLALARTLATTDAGTGLMHESFDADDPADYTRPWFSWANSMFCELLLTLAAAGPQPGPEMV